MAAENLTKKTFDKVLSPVRNFMAVETSGGIVLLVSAVAALLLANLPTASSYFEFIKTPVSIGVGSFSLDKNLLLLVNDGLMAIFFFLIGLEIKREILMGELSSPKKASFSIFAAIGGMAIPALFYVGINSGGDFMSGWGIPMATDIAFALGLLALVGSGVPIALKVFLLALAIVDDLGAILVIAMFYTSEVSANYLGIAAGCLGLLFLLNHAGLRNVVFGLVLGFVTWFCFLKSGIHATVAGVLLAFLAPANSLDDLIHALHPWVAFFIMPVFAFFNSGVSFEGFSLQVLTSHPVSLGIALGLLFGKPIGIMGFSYLATKFKLAEKPRGVTWPQVFGVSMLAGIGFTMSLFIGSLAFSNPEIQSIAKLSIMMASLVAMLVGFSILKFSVKNSKEVGDG